MKHKLLILNLVLLALIGLCGARIRQEYLAAGARERAVLGKRLADAPPPPIAKLSATEPVTPAGYIEIAQKMLFSKDRNPTVVVEAAVPPPKPVPALPVVYGVMSFPDGPTVVMAEKSGTRHRGIRLGEGIGEFKLAGVTQDEISLEWDGQVITRKLEELAERAPAQGAASNTSARTASALSAAPATPKPAPHVEAGPGVETRDGEKACVAGDASEAGTVVGGMRKVVTQTPFGSACRWVPAN